MKEKKGWKGGIRWFINNIFIDIDTGEILNIKNKKELEKRLHYQTNNKTNKISKQWKNRNYYTNKRVPTQRTTRTILNHKTTQALNLSINTVRNHEKMERGVLRWETTS